MILITSNFSYSAAANITPTLSKRGIGVVVVTCISKLSFVCIQACYTFSTTVCGKRNNQHGMVDDSKSFL